MEHRWHTRDTVLVDCILYHQGIPVVSCSAHDLSPKGAYVRPSALNIAVNTPVDVEFTVTRNHHTERFRLKAQVVHKENGGTGLAFNTTQPDAGNVIGRLMASAAGTHAA